MKTEALLERIDKQMDLVQDIYQELFQIKEMVLNLENNVVDFTELGFSYDISKDEYRLQIPGYFGYVLYTSGVLHTDNKFCFELYCPQGYYMDSWYFSEVNTQDIIDTIRLFIGDNDD